MSIHRPNDRDLESGDILWRREIDQTVPLHTMSYPPADDALSTRSAGTGDPTVRMPSPAEVWESIPDAPEWNRRKAALIEALARNPDWQRDGRLDRLRALERPVLTPSRNGRPNGMRPQEFDLPGRRFYIGHPSIVHRDGGRLMMIDATWTAGGVQCKPHEDWVKDMPGASHWHGRLRGFDAQRRAAVAQAALSIRDSDPRPAYSLWDPAAFDLLDNTSTYCSKLVWTAVYMACEIPIDGNPDPKRFWWFTPRASYQCEAFVHFPGRSQPPY